jgi:hypothetical protein
MNLTANFFWIWHFLAEAGRAEPSLQKSLHNQFPQLRQPAGLPALSIFPSHFHTPLVFNIN